MAKPRLVYIGDVPVEASYHGSALLHRLLSDYPAERLCVVETATPSLPARRLSDVEYLPYPIAKQRLLNTRFHPHAVGWFSRVAARAGARISELVDGFECESVLTVAHGFGWLAAADFAVQRNLPLHLMVHDDWPRVADVKPAFREWIDKRFESVYRQARSRFCVSPAMRAAYQARYGAPAEVLYPIRAANCPEFETVPARVGQNEAPFTIAFAGSINSTGYIEALRRLQEALNRVDGRLLIFGPLTKAEAERVGFNSITEVCGLLSSSELMSRLRERADALFVPMSFDTEDFVNMQMAFPSKLADYTAVGLPLLIYGPHYCSAVVWARENSGVAEIVEREDLLSEGVARLANKPDLRINLGRRALEIGKKYFSHATAQQLFNPRFPCSCG